MSGDEVTEVLLSNIVSERSARTVTRTSPLPTIINADEGSPRRVMTRNGLPRAIVSARAMQVRAEPVASTTTVVYNELTLSHPDYTCEEMAAAILGELLKFYSTSQRREVGLWPMLRRQRYGWLSGVDNAGGRLKNRPTLTHVILAMIDLPPGIIDASEWRSTDWMSLTTCDPTLDDLLGHRQVLKFINHFRELGVPLPIDENCWEDFLYELCVCYPRAVEHLLTFHPDLKFTSSPTVMCSYRPNLEILSRDSIIMMQKLGFDFEYFDFFERLLQAATLGNTGPLEYWIEEGLPAPTPESFEHGYMSQLLDYSYAIDPPTLERLLTYLLRADIKGECIPLTLIIQRLSLLELAGVSGYFELPACQERFLQISPAMQKFTELQRAKLAHRKRSLPN